MLGREVAVDSRDNVIVKAPMGNSTHLHVRAFVEMLDEPLDLANNCPCCRVLAGVFERACPERLPSKPDPTHIENERFWMRAEGL